ncbi:MAG TPA: single-stranded-DNA-specific exonuclease RecJ [Casimicrobiaceae bacterium]|nr:single-stranded-DNA-specific exonuclease RecJ [Casimicrobiaceae bacterium]
MQIVRRPVPAAASALIAAGVTPVLARIYAARSVLAVAELDVDLALLPSWRSFKGIEPAAQRLADSIERGERVLIIADYDADGATACAVGMRGLVAMGAKVDYLVPNRFEFGYGLTPEIVALAATRSPHLIVTVDNGMGSVDGVAAAHARGIDVLITDHHLPGPLLPSPALIVNPNQEGCGFPCKHVAGVGVMFYVLTAVRALLRERKRFADGAGPNLAALLDLVALGTVADVVKLDQTNRILVAQGLRRIRAGRACAGIQALFEVARCDAAQATTYDLGFIVAPRLNAAGRLADMSVGIACLIAEDKSLALRCATELDRLNQERREVEAKMQGEALASIADATIADGYTLCLYRAEWHPGVVGIIASRLKDRFHRPALVFARSENGELRGSGRGIPGFHLRDAIDLVAKRTSGAILRFGGHAHAAGLSVVEDALPRVAAEFERVAREWLPPSALSRALETDGELGPDELTLGLADRLREQVWGQGFPAPLFDGEFVVSDQRMVGGEHVRAVLTRSGRRVDAIAFRTGGPLPATLRAVYRPDRNIYQGLSSLQLILEHWQPELIAS